MCVRKKKTPPLGIWKANTVLWCPLSYKISALRGWNKLWNMHISKAKVYFLAVHFRLGNAKAEAFHLESEIRRGRQKDQLTDASLRKSSAIIYVKRVPNDWFRCHSDTAEQRSDIYTPVNINGFCLGDFITFWHTVYIHLQGFWLWPSYVQMLRSDKLLSKKLHVSHDLIFKTQPEVSALNSQHFGANLFFPKAKACI